MQQRNHWLNPLLAQCEQDVRQDLDLNELIFFIQFFDHTLPLSPLISSGIPLLFQVGKTVSRGAS